MKTTLLHFFVALPKKSQNNQLPIWNNDVAVGIQSIQAGDCRCSPQLNPPDDIVCRTGAFKCPSQLPNCQDQGTPPNTYPVCSV
ncbi:hypothetical protein F8M41_004154 [Gigaspora margarita]|uniref:Uncharacterized protein n=1 Tax=Gigaspora margarita TaxID=4874 RepID=A0A8H4A5M8_GIGMA|nr:hypothetical protein F8M41_004154 [Gigaspora margarita]